MSTTRSFLLQNATILVPRSNDDTVAPLRNHDLLVEGNKISRIARHIQSPSDQTEIIDCSGKILSPGFVDTHHHVWQTQLKGRHGDHTLMEYVPTGNMQSSNYTPEDVFWGELGGCLEALNAGTTTVVDHAHMNYSPKHNTNAIAAIASSGIRSIFCYTMTTRVKEWQPTMAVDPDHLPDWAIQQLEQLATEAPFGDGRVNIGLGFDSFFLPREVITDLYERSRRAGTKLITSHYVRGAVFGQHSLLDVIDGYGLMGPDILISHANNMTDEDGKKLKKTNTFVSSTPDTELQMGLGYPVCFRDDIKTLSSLGIDCHSNNSGSIVGQMRLGLQAERARRNEPKIQDGKGPKHLDISVQDAFRLGTIGGARAANLQDQIGSLEEGKIADIVIFDGLSPSMICAAEQDPVAAIVLHSSVSDVDGVICDGQIRKLDGKLYPIQLDLEGSSVDIAKTSLTWAEVAQTLLDSRRQINERDEKGWPVLPFKFTNFLKMQLGNTDRSVSHKIPSNLIPSFNKFNEALQAIYGRTSDINNFDWKNDGTETVVTTCFEEPTDLLKVLQDRGVCKKS
ncbi:hypothetical protein FDECE_12221 [Fusarium decemcellulare]|nr:hypothetical protein FDECE_12221 [Fusarium decemcellulare]